MNHFHGAASCLTPFLIAVGMRALKPITKPFHFIQEDVAARVHGDIDASLLCSGRLSKAPETARLAAFMRMEKWSAAAVVNGMCLQTI